MEDHSAPSRIEQASSDRLKITEIFTSLQGEARDVGRPTVFIRLTGCPLRCHYCDTAYAFHGGQWMSFEDIFAAVAKAGVRHVCVTGGEPLAQKRVIGLLEQLCECGYAVSLETSGAIDISPVDTRVSRILDLKTPASGEAERNLWTNLEHLTAHDQIKFVVCSRDDYDWAKQAIFDKRLPEHCDVLLSPSFKQVEPAELAGWILQDKLPVRMQLQLHKILWGDQPGR